MYLVSGGELDEGALTFINLDIDAVTYTSK